MTISFDDFKKCDLRIGRVISAEPVEKSEKLLRLLLDLGEKSEGGEMLPRQILSGIAKSYSPESLVGKSVVIIANLEPRQMMGLESHGMLLAATNADGLPVVLLPEQEVEPGAEVR